MTSVDTGSDHMTFTYHMRSGMKWSDGQPFTANDVAWTYAFYIKNNVSNYAADIKLIGSVTATDDTTFVIKSNNPTSFYSGELGLPLRLHPARAHLEQVRERLQGREAVQEHSERGLGSLCHLRTTSRASR